jgi:hypothetical protein
VVQLAQPRDSSQVVLSNHQHFLIFDYKTFHRLRLRQASLEIRPRRPFGRQFVVRAIQYRQSARVVLSNCQYSIILDYKGFSRFSICPTGSRDTARATTSKRLDQSETWEPAKVVLSNCQYFLIFDYKTFYRFRFGQANHEIQLRSSFLDRSL